MAMLFYVSTALKFGFFIIICFTFFTLRVKETIFWQPSKNPEEKDWFSCIFFLENAEKKEYDPWLIQLIGQFS